MADENMQNPSDRYESDHNQDPEIHGADPGRVTSPMQRFSSGQAMTGFVVLVVGLAIVFGLPLLL